MKQKQTAKGLKVKTSVKAGECCWNAYRTAQQTGKSSDWNNFQDCCKRDKKCTYF